MLSQHCDAGAPQRLLRRLRLYRIGPARQLEPEGTGALERDGGGCLLRPMTGVRGYRQWCICGASSVLSCMLDPTEPRTVTCTCMLGTLVPVWPSSWRRHQLEAKPEPMRAAAAAVCPVAQLARATASSSLGCILNPTVPASLFDCADGQPTFDQDDCDVGGVFLQRGVTSRWPAFNYM